jgi:DNA-binding GntR family transcriptional regulator
VAEAQVRTPSVRQIGTTSVVDQVTKEIRRSILSGALRPGQEFSLREIAAELGVSFIPVREALRRLEGQGLVVTQRGKSASVVPLSHQDLHGIYRLRRQIEPEIAARSCLLLADQDFVRLDAVVQTFADERLGIDEVYEAHHNFHLELLRPAATTWDIQTLETLWHAAERYIRLAFSGLDAAPDEHNRREHAHHEMIDAFRSRDPKTVSTSVLHHLDANEQIAQRAIV